MTGSTERQAGIIPETAPRTHNKNGKNGVRPRFSWFLRGFWGFGAHLVRLDRIMIIDPARK
ncbi:MAG: hypothetical protein KBD39_09010 [Sterolibacterium sp.]|nr:hypothetical protein [Sterolibacterium sp.]